MARFILIDNNSGYIWGDSADLDGKIFETSDPMEYARALDESLGEHGRAYEMIHHNPRDTRIGYHTYRADIDGSEAVPVVQDGQSAETCDAVERNCRYVGFIEITEAAE